MIARSLRPTLALLLLSTTAWCDAPKPAAPADRNQIMHVLNRLGYGARPGDVEAVQKLGLNAYIQQQLHPETIDDSAVEEQLKDFSLLGLSSAELHQLYNEQRKAYSQARNKQYSKERSAESATMDGGSAPSMAEESMMDQPNMAAAGRDMADNEMAPRNGKGPRPQLVKTELMERVGPYSSAVTQLSHAKLIRAINSPRQLQEVLVDFWGNHFNVDMKKTRCIVYKVADDRDVIRPNILGHFRDLLEASAKSPAMLWYLDNVQNSVPGQFEEQKAARQARQTARRGAADAAADGEMMADQPKPRQQKKRSLGINENYAREIMELHTLGVDGGYTQKDVQEVARCFTGWTIDQQTGEFTFDAEHHDNGPKSVLGHVIPANGGIKDGEQVFDILSASPATARHIAYKLCQRFVSDEPPPKLVEKVAAVFTKTGGDLRAVTEAVITSPEFLDSKQYASKIKSPFEFVVSAVRASGSQYVENIPTTRRGSALRDSESAAVLGKGAAGDRYAALSSQPLNWQVFLLGQPLFACTPPTGYKEQSNVWVNPGALIARLNFAMALTESKVSDIHYSPQNVIGSADLDQPQAVLDQCVATLLPNGLTPATKNILNEVALPQMGGGQTVNPNKLVALVIGSPEFQRR